MTITAFLAVAIGAAPIDTRMVRFPAIHGDQVVFTYASDLWMTDTSGSIARRLTSFPGSETRASFSPDGKWIAFSASFEGAGEVYVMPAQGGEPKRLTFEPTNDAVLGWTPDGKIAYTSGNGTPSNRQSRLWYVSPNGGMPITHQTAANRQPLSESTHSDSTGVATVVELRGESRFGILPSEATQNFLRDANRAISPCGSAIQFTTSVTRISTTSTSIATTRTRSDLSRSLSLVTETSRFRARTARASSGKETARSNCSILLREVSRTSFR